MPKLSPFRNKDPLQLKKYLKSYREWKAALSPQEQISVENINFYGSVLIIVLLLLTLLLALGAQNMGHVISD